MKLKRILLVTIAAAVALQFAACAKIAGNAPMRAGSVSVSEEMYSYMINSYYKDFAEQNSAYLTAMGLDASKDIKSQTYGDSGKDTWYTYISSGFKAKLEKTLALANGAEEKKLTLTEDNKKEIEDTLSEYEKEAKAQGMKLNSYLEENFGKGVDRDCAEKCLEIEKLAEQYEECVRKDAMNLTEKDCESYYENSPETMLRYDCIKITVPKDKVEKFMNAYDENSFMTAVTETLTELKFMGDYGTFKDKIEAQAAEKRLVGEAKTVGNPLSDWAFAQGRKPYDKYTALQSTGEVTVAMILSAKDKDGAYSDVLYRDADRLKNAEIVFVNDEAEAKSVTDKYKNGITEKDFSDLAEKYGSQKTENISRSTCIKEIKTWLFSPETKKGSAALIPCQDGAYAVKYEGEGEIAWIYEAKQAAATDAVNKKLAELKEKYPTEFDNEKISQIAVIPIVK